MLLTRSHCCPGGGTTTVETIRVPVTQTVAATAHASGDAVGGKIGFANAVLFSGGSGTLQTVVIRDKAAQGISYDLILFNSDPSAATITDDAPFDFSTDLAKCIGYVSVDDMSTGVGGVLTASGLGLQFKLESGTTLYAALVARGAPTYASTSDVSVEVVIIPDPLVASPTLKASVNQTVAATAHASGDAVGGKISFANVADVSGGGGTVQTVIVRDKSAQSTSYDLILFDADPSAATITDDAPFDFSTDLSKCIGHIPIDDMATGTGGVLTAAGLGMQFKLSTGTTLYGALVARGAPTYASTSDISVEIVIIPD